MSINTRVLTLLVALSAAGLITATPAANAATVNPDFCGAIACGGGDRACAEVHVTYVETICPEEDMCEDYYYDLPTFCYEKKAQT